MQMPDPRFVARARFAACTAAVLGLLSSGASNAARVLVRDAALFYQARVDAPPLQLPTDGPVQAATLTPDGAWILYRTVRAGMLLGNGGAYEVTLRIMRTDGSQAQLLSERRLLAAWNARVEDLLLPFAYAPDGREVYFGDDEHVYRSTWQQAPVPWSAKVASFASSSGESGRASSLCGVRAPTLAVGASGSSTSRESRSGS